MNLYAAPGIAVRELPTATRPADYMLFLDRRACGVLEAKPAGTTLLGVGPQAAGYAAAPAAYPASADPLPLYYLSTGAETLLRDAGDPLPAPRPVFAAHRPKALRRMLQAQGGRLRARLAAMPPLNPGTLRACQVEAIEGVEASLAVGHPRALVQIAIDAGKTYAACALSHRLLTHARMGRILFLVDRANLGDQTIREFQDYKPPGGDLRFAEKYVVQHLRGRAFNPDAQLVACTIQRLYAALRGEDLDDAGRAQQVRGRRRHAPPGRLQPGYPAGDLRPCYRGRVPPQRLRRLASGTGLVRRFHRRPDSHAGQAHLRLLPEEHRERVPLRALGGGRGQRRVRGVSHPHRHRRARRHREDRVHSSPPQPRHPRPPLGEDLAYTGAQLNRVVEAPNQIRTVLRAYRDALPVQLFPSRGEVPQTFGCRWRIRS